MSDPGSPIASFPCSEIVYRAIRKQWIDKQTSELKFEAFLRRPKELGGDADGLSADLASVGGLRGHDLNALVAGLAFPPFAILGEPASLLQGYAHSPARAGRPRGTPKSST